LSATFTRSLHDALPISFQSSFQCSQRRLDSSFVVSRQFVACFFNLLTGAVQQMVALVASLYQLFKLTVSFGVSFCVAYHFLDFKIGRAPSELQSRFDLV